MAGGKGPERRGKRGDGPSSGKGSVETAAADRPGRQAKRKKQGGFPWWMWVVVALAVVIFAGKAISSLTSSSPAKGGSGKASKKGKSGKSSTERFLEMALRLQEMTQLGTALEQSGALDSEAATELNRELAEIEAELGGDDDAIARDLRSMVSVVRGTLYQRSENLTDAQVEEKTNSFTYANPRYWDDYYNKTEQGEMYDWYGSWDTAIEETSSPRQAARIGDLLRPYLAPETKLLMLGCGNSDMSEKMYRDGFENIVNVDISEKLLENLRARLGKEMPKMSWRKMDASAMTFDSETFDVTLDKGTFDAIEQNKPLLLGAVAEAHRTLRPGGMLLSVTFNSPELRVEGQLRQGAAWGECRTHAFQRGGQRQEKTTYYVHACRRE